MGDTPTTIAALLDVDIATAQLAAAASQWATVAAAVHTGDASQELLRARWATLQAAARELVRAEQALAQS